MQIYVRRMLTGTLCKQVLQVLHVELFPQGLVSILAAASQHPTWTSTLNSLSLEMNGLGDEGCVKIVESCLDLPWICLALTRAFFGEALV